MKTTVYIFTLNEIGRCIFFIEARFNIQCKPVTAYVQRFIISQPKTRPFPTSVVSWDERHLML